MIQQLAGIPTVTKRHSLGSLLLGLKRYQALLLKIDQDVPGYANRGIVFSVREVDWLLIYGNHGSAAIKQKGGHKARPYALLSTVNCGRSTA